MPRAARRRSHFLSPLKATQESPAKPAGTGLTKASLSNSSSASHASCVILVLFLGSDERRSVLDPDLGKVFRRHSSSNGKREVVL